MQEPHPIAEILRLSLIVEMGHDILATDEKHPARPFGNRHQLGRNYPIRRRSAFYLTIFSLRRPMSERERKKYPTCRTQLDRKSTRLNSSHSCASRTPSSA